MSLAHLTLPTSAVERTALFLERTLGYTRDATPANTPMQAVWLAAGGGQQLHIIHVDNFAVSPFEGEFGRHLAILHPAQELAALQDRLRAEGAEVMQPLRPSAHERFFFRDPINGYVFEVIAA